MNEIYYYFLLFLIYSFIGWLIEVIGKLIEKHKFINRGFLVGPICPIYGHGCLLMILTLSRYKDNPLTLFIYAIFICSLLEYFTSFFMEKIFKARWWDYTNRKFNINGRVCLQNLVIFGILGTFIVFVANPFLIKYINMIPITTLHIILGIFSFIFLLDTIVSYKLIFELKDISRELKDNTIEISEKVKKRIRSWKIGLYRRFVRAFPRIKDYVRYNRWEEIKKKIEESKEGIKEKIVESTSEIKEKIQQIKPNQKK